MANYHIGGTLYKATHTAVEAALREALGGLGEANDPNISSGLKGADELNTIEVGELTVKVPLQGYNMHSGSEQLDLHLQTTDNAGSIWYLTADLKGTTKDLNALMQNLTKALVKADILYLIDHTEMDANDEPISEEVSLSHPEFDERYSPGT